MLGVVGGGGLNQCGLRADCHKPRLHGCAEVIFGQIPIYALWVITSSGSEFPWIRQQSQAIDIKKANVLVE
jgi:hypothetical protein